MISALAITYNEEQHIERFIKDLSFADEIIIVDSNSTDRTVTIAETLGAKVVVRDFDNFSSQKNFAISLATHDWIVFFDADEAVSPELAKEIQSKIGHNNANAYKAKRHIHFMGKRIKYSGFQNDAVVRAFRKGTGKYNGSLVHETLEVEGKVEMLKNALEHYTYSSFDTYNEKLTHYAKLQATMLYDKKSRPNLYHFFVRPFWRKLGILDGKEGFILAYLSAFAVFKRYLFLWTMYRNIS